MYGQVQALVSSVSHIHLLAVVSYGYQIVCVHITIPRLMYQLLNHLSVSHSYCTNLTTHPFPLFHLIHSVRTGFDHPFSGENSELLCTIFSASNYGGGGNSGAYMVFTRDPSLNKRMGVSSDENEEGTHIMPQRIVVIISK